MKKFLACALALTLTSAMFASCGSSDDSSSKAEAKTTTTTTTAATTTEATTTTAAPESTADSTAASGTESEGDAAKDISEMPATLKNYEEASVYFKKDMDVASIVEPFAEKDYENDESHVNLSVEELAGVPMLKVEVLDQDDQGNYKIPKIKFHMEKFFEGHEADLEKIFTIKADVVTKAVGEFTGDDGTKSLVPGNFMGAFVTQPTTGEGENSWNDLYDFGEAEWTSEWGSYELTMRPGIKDGATFVNSTEPQYVSLMRWGIPNQADFYIADLRFEDEDGNVIACANFGKQFISIHKKGADFLCTFFYVNFTLTSPDIFKLFTFPPLILAEKSCPFICPVAVMSPLSFLRYVTPFCEISLSSTAAVIVTAELSGMFPRSVS